MENTLVQHYSPHSDRGILPLFSGKERGLRHIDKSLLLTEVGVMLD